MPWSVIARSLRNRSRLLRGDHADHRRLRTPRSRVERPARGCRCRTRCRASESTICARGQPHRRNVRSGFGDGHRTGWGGGHRCPPAGGVTAIPSGYRALGESERHRRRSDRRVDRHRRFGRSGRDRRRAVDDRGAGDGCRRRVHDRGRSFGAVAASVDPTPTDSLVDRPSGLIRRTSTDPNQDDGKPTHEDPLIRTRKLFFDRKLNHPASSREFDPDSSLTTRTYAPVMPGMCASCKSGRRSDHRICTAPKRGTLSVSFSWISR